ncbi:MAG: type II secretion system F family protein [Longimicrobiales bacterium]|nr:type II secretion system F family protein [Longimicrobiales bacterium]
MPRPEPWVLAVAAALSAVMAVVVVVQAAAAYREWRLRKDALASLQGGDSRRGQDQAEPQAASVVRTSEDLEGSLMGALAERFPRLWDLHHLLQQSGLEWTLGGFFVRVMAVGLLVAAVCAASMGPIVAFVGFVMAAPAPLYYVRWKKARRILQLEAQLPGAIDLMARAVRAGHPLSEGLRMASQEASEPLASEFRITFEEQKFGLPFEDALMGLGDRVEVVDVRILITAILVQREVGGNLSEILEQIAETMRERFSLKRQVRVYTAQGRMSGYTLAALPIIVGLVISLINPSYMRTLFVDPIGQALLVCAAVLQGIGFLWIRRIVDVRY